MCDRLRPLREIKDLDTSELSEEEIDRLMKAQALGLISDGSPNSDSPSDDGSDDEQYLTSIFGSNQKAKTSFEEFKARIKKEKQRRKFHYLIS